MTIANWCLLIAILLPYVWFGVANAKAGVKRDNDNPRAFLNELTGAARGALGAHQNSFEVNGGFIAGVLVAEFAHAPQGRVDALAAAFIAFRIAHGLLYIGGKGGPRSVMFFGGFACTIALFVTAAMH